MVNSFSYRNALQAVCIFDTLFVKKADQTPDRDVLYGNSRLKSDFFNTDYIIIFSHMK